MKDSREEVAAAFEEMSEKYDIIISSGGISMGKYDFVKDVFRNFDYEILFLKGQGSNLGVRLCSQRGAAVLS